MGKALLGSLVGVSASATIGAYWFLPWPDLRCLSGPPPILAFNANFGTGFFIDRDGYALTNRHVVRDCRRITAAGPGFRAAPVELVLVPSDPAVDLALIRVSVSAPATLAFSDEPWPAGGNGMVPVAQAQEAMQAAAGAKDGQTEMIGYPGSDRGSMPESTSVTMTASVNTSDHRHWWRRFDGPVMQGSSGSPIVNQRQEVVGVTFKLTADLDEKTHAVRPGDIVDTEFGLQGKHGLMVPAAIGLAFLQEAGRSPTVASIKQVDLSKAVIRVFCFQTFPTAG